MSLFDASKNKDKKKAGQQATKAGFAGPKSGKGNSKAAAKTTRVTGRAQRGS